ncbi:MAG: hypothetical protein ACK55I_14505, partial [bacterium]
LLVVAVRSVTNREDVRGLGDAVAGIVHHTSGADRAKDGEHLLLAIGPLPESTVEGLRDLVGNCHRFCREIGSGSSCSPQ